MVTLCVFLTRIKQKNETIVSKVVVMAEKQRRSSADHRHRTLETAGSGKGGPVASSKPFRDDEDNVSISQSGILAVEEDLSIGAAQKAQPKMLYAYQAASGSS